MRHNSIFMPLAIVSAIATAQSVYAETFRVGDIRIDGLVRLTPAAVYNLLPLSAGEQVDDAAIAEAVKTLYASGNFDDVQVVRSDDVLTFKVVERPVIAHVQFEGNRQIPKEMLEQGLKKMGISEGEIYKKSLLQSVQQELEQQYAQQGRYDAKVTVETTALPNNRVALKLKFDEGIPARVVSINVIGNHVFSDKEIERVFAVKESSWSSIITRNDRYAKEKMTASLEALRAMYLNAGYVNFNVNSSQLNLSEDKKHIFIEVNITEGDKYQFGETQFLGDTLYDAKELQKLQTYKSGETFSQTQILTLKNQLLRKYGNAGYYFADVNIVPMAHDDSKTVDIAYYINPGQQITVRRINFSGNNKTADEVLRREMRQLEGSLASNEKIELSKIRLQRTGFFKSVEITPMRVPNAPDQMDLDVKVEEQLSGTSTIAVGYSQSGGFTYQFGVSQNNFMGTGNRVSFDLSRSSTVDYYNLNVYDPYFTIDGVSRGYNLYYRKTKLSDSYSVSDYVTDSLGGSLTFGYPLNENQSVSATVNVDETKVTTGSSASTYVVDYLKEHGGNVTQIGCVEASADQCVKTYPSQVVGKFRTYNLNLAWAYDTLNRPIFPTSGYYHRVGLDIAAPGSDVEYQRLTYDAQAYYPLGKGFVLHGYGRLGYGYNLPFYKNYFAGGWGSVRGYESSTLGPRYGSAYYDALGQTDPSPEEVGGNAIIQGGVELVLPLPSKDDWTNQIRPVLFAEGGQVYDTKSTEYDVKLNDIRYSVGVGFTWNTMIGPLSLSYAYPLNKKEGDQTQNIQFQIGGTF